MCTCGAAGALCVFGICLRGIVLHSGPWNQRAKGGVGYGWGCATPNPVSVQHSNEQYYTKLNKTLDFLGTLWSNSFTVWGGP